MHAGNIFKMNFNIFWFDRLKLFAVKQVSHVHVGGLDALEYFKSDIDESSVQGNLHSCENN